MGGKDGEAPSLSPSCVVGRAAADDDLIIIVYRLQVGYHRLLSTSDILPFPHHNKIIVQVKL